MGGGGEGTEQTPGLGLMRALFKEALSQTGLALRRRQKGYGKGESEAMARFQAMSCRAALGAAQVWCLECHYGERNQEGEEGPFPSPPTPLHTPHSPELCLMQERFLIPITHPTRSSGSEEADHPHGPRLSGELMADYSDTPCPQPHGAQETLSAPTGCRLLWGGQRLRIWVIGQCPRRLVKGWELRYCLRLQVKGLSLRQKVKRHDLGCDQVRGCIQLLLGLR